MSTTQNNNAIMNTYRLTTSTSCGTHAQKTYRAVTVNHAINQAREECKRLIDKLGCNKVSYCIDRKRDGFHICSDIVDAYQC